MYVGIYITLSTWNGVIRNLSHTNDDLESNSGLYVFTFFKK